MVCIICIIYNILYAIIFSLPLLALLSKRIRAKIFRAIAKILNKAKGS